MHHNYGQASNSEICDCGDHHGVGAWSPLRRACIYQSMKDAGHTLDEYQRHYLFSYIHKHGEVEYHRVYVGENQGEFVKSSKGKPVNGVFPIGEMPCYRLGGKSSGKNENW